MGFKCTSIIFSIWCSSIFLACFSLQATLGFTCGEFGYTCINHRYYQKCDKEKNTRDIKVISVCPRNTVCVTTRPNPCQPSKPPNPCIPSNANSLQQINLEEEHKLAVQTPEAKAQVNQIIKDKISDSAPLENIDESTNDIKLPGTTPPSLGSDIPEMKISATTTISSANLTGPIKATTPATIGALTTEKANIQKDNEKSDKEHEKSEEHKEGHEKSEEHKEGHEKSEEHKEEGHEKSGEHKEDHGKNDEHKEEGHEKSEEHKEGHEKSEEHKEGHGKNGEEHKEEGHEKSEEHKEGHDKSEEHKEGHEKSEEHHGEEHKEGHKEEGHEKSEEHHEEEHKKDHKEEGHKEDAESEDDQHVKHDNGKEDQHAEHGNHEETTKHPEEHTTTPAAKKQIYGKKNEEKFVCPHPGSFPKEESKECFYVCYRNQRSTNMDLKAINVCCPKGMYFNSKIHKCSDCETKTGKAKLSRRKRHRRWKRRGYLRI